MYEKEHYIKQIQKGLEDVNISDVARRCKMSRRYLTGIKKNQEGYNNPTYETIVKIDNCIKKIKRERK